MDWIKPDWPAPNNVHAATTLRTGGLSQGGFSSLNLALHVNDDVAIVNNNRQNITKALDLPSQPAWIEQVHGSHVVKADNRRVQIADASYTDQANSVCAILTADCLPVLLCNTDGSKVAAIHAGWRGLLAGIIGKTVKKMDANNIVAWLGPAIGAEQFEVGVDVYSAFTHQPLNYLPAFKQHKHNKFLLDIYQLATIELHALGITQIAGGNFCTVTDKQRFYSYRRDGETGRIATFIWRD